jgi:carbon storage regulator
MLVLTRRIGEEVLIAGNVRVMVVAIKGKRVRLGITAPAAIPVIRPELLAERADNAGATSLGCPALQVRAGPVK